MIYLLLLLGMISGFLLRKKKKVHSIVESATTYVIYILLFFMGFSVGTNKAIVRSLPKLGLQAAFISIFAILGSVLLSMIVYKFFFKNNEK